MSDTSTYIRPARGKSLTPRWIIRRRSGRILAGTRSSFQNEEGELWNMSEPSFSLAIGLSLAV